MLKRVATYLKEMYPVLPRLASAGVHYYALYLLLAASCSFQPELLAPPALAGWLTFFLFLLFLRVSDELKDLEADRVLFPERAVPAGRVLPKDLWLLWGGALALMVGVNAWMPRSLPALAVLLGYGLLMFRYFFAPRLIAGNLLLALATHNPVVVLMNVYGAAVVAQQHRLEPATATLVFVACWLWLPGLLWELSRKIRAPHEETEYVTYSRLLGARGAAAVVAGVILLHVGLLAWAMVSRQVPLSPLALGLAALAGLAAVGVFGAFMVRPARGSRLLRPAAEAYILVCLVGVSITLAWFSTPELPRGVKAW